MSLALRNIDHIIMHPFVSILISHVLNSQMYTPCYCVFLLVHFIHESCPLLSKFPSALAETKGVYVCIGSTVLYLVFVVVLGATVERKVLLTDYMITEKVSALGKLSSQGNNALI